MREDLAGLLQVGGADCAIACFGAHFKYRSQWVAMDGDDAGRYCNLIGQTAQRFGASGKYLLGKDNATNDIAIFEKTTSQATWLVLL